MGDRVPAVPKTIVRERQSSATQPLPENEGFKSQLTRGFPRINFTRNIIQWEEAVA